MRILPFSARQINLGVTNCVLSSLCRVTLSIRIIISSVVSPSTIGQFLEGLLRDLEPFIFSTDLVYY